MTQENSLALGTPGVSQGECTVGSWYFLGQREVEDASQVPTLLADEQGHLQGPSLGTCCSGAFLRRVASTAVRAQPGQRRKLQVCKVCTEIVPARQEAVHVSPGRLVGLDSLTSGLGDPPSPGLAWAP